MATINQEKTAQKVKEMIESSKLMNGGELLEMVGYSDGITKSPNRVFESKGFKEAMKRLGFSLEAADLAVAKILSGGKEENRLKASDQIYKRLGGYSPEKHISLNIELSKEDLDEGNKAIEQA